MCRTTRNTLYSIQAVGGGGGEEEGGEGGRGEKERGVREVVDSRQMATPYHTQDIPTEKHSTSFLQPVIIRTHNTTAFNERANNPFPIASIHY